MELHIAENLKIMRQKYGYTLEALAEIISVSRQTVAKWEAGDSHPDIINCIKLANLYKMSLDELVNKPLMAVQKNDFAPENGRICGVLDISDEGSINLPKPVMELFDIKCGDKVLLLADKTQGLALVKCSQF
ncbi:MAG: helix-turn-helix domain-containing protein [Bacillota bacterium]|nr:helix-turn-helix domain-containing protein [Bacillota bacterium]